MLHFKGGRQRKSENTFTKYKKNSPKSQSEKRLPNLTQRIIEYMKFNFVQTKGHAFLKERKYRHYKYIDEI